MGRSPDDVAFELGLRIRAGRIRLGLTREEVEAASGISRSTQSRVELGHGAGASLATWVRLATAVGDDPFGEWAEDEGSYPAALTRLMEPGGWRPVEQASDDLWFERPVRPIPTLRHVQWPAERLVVLLLRTLTDPDRELGRLDAEIERARSSAPAGMVTNGTIVVVRSTAAIRTANTRGLGRSRSGWISALRSAEGRMPRYPGWIWLAPRGSHLLPWG
jgi:transcriptional regulator with XRE-family HTH domain